MQKRFIAQLKFEREAQEARQGDAGGAPDEAASSINLRL